MPSSADVANDWLVQAAARRQAVIDVEMTQREKEAQLMVGLLPRVTVIPVLTPVYIALALHVRVTAQEAVMKAYHVSHSRFIPTTTMSLPAIAASTSRTISS